jgi:hypothetical protein
VSKRRSLLLRIEIRPAGRLSKCTHNRKHAIKKGELRFVVRESGPASGEQGYCMACAKEMLDRLDAEAAALRAALLTSNTAG